MKLGILGGGLTGLSLAHFYEGDCEVLEKDAVCGGLCRSVTKDGYVYDQGGHIIFSRDEEVLDFMVGVLGENDATYRRNNKVWFNGRLVKYPFENGLADLPKRDRYDCLYHFLKRSRDKPNNLKEWCYHRFGKGIAERYLIPYNEKIWNIDAEKLGLEWVAGRVPEPPFEDILKSAVGIETEGYKHQLNFHHPKRGGIEELVRAIESKVSEVEKDFCVKRMRRAGEQWVVSDGVREKEYDRIVSTIPITELLDTLEDVPEQVRKAAARLRYASLICVMIGVASDKRSDKFAVYFPDRDLMFHRICYYDFLGGGYAPRGRSSIVAEITAVKGDGTYEMSDKQLVDEVVGGLEKEGFIRGGDVRETDVSRREYAYVVNDLEYSRNLRTVREHVEGRGIVLCGRFAEWKYLNMDDCIRHAMNTASALTREGERKPAS